MPGQANDVVKVANAPAKLSGHQLCCSTAVHVGITLSAEGEDPVEVVSRHNATQRSYREQTERLCDGTKLDMEKLFKSSTFSFSCFKGL